MPFSFKQNFLCLIATIVFSSTFSQPFNTPLVIPDTLSGDTIDLTIQPSTYQFLPGNATNTFAYNGDYLGPTVISDKGNFVQLNVTNNLPDTTTTHWHGMHVAPEDDGGPHTAIIPGATWSPDFEVLDNATTFWYHPHLHGETNRDWQQCGTPVIIRFFAWPLFCQNSTGRNSYCESVCCQLNAWKAYVKKRLVLFWSQPLFVVA